MSIPPDPWIAVATARARGVPEQVIARKFLGLRDGQRAYGVQRSDSAAPAVVVVPGPKPRPVAAKAPPAPIPVPAPAAAPVPSISVSDVLRAVSEAWGVSRDDILSRRIGRRENRPRFAAYLLLRERMALSFPAIAHATCRRNHTSACSGVLRAIGLREHDPEWRERFERAEARLKAGG